MRDKELTNYIQNYLENDKTRSAIMLTGAWGSGKSYYIQNTLVKELNACKCDVVCVSLYGLKTIQDINKNIYLELRAKKIAKKIKNKFHKQEKDKDKKGCRIFKWIKSHGREVTRGAILFGKTIVKGVAGYFSIPLEFSDKDIEKLLASIKLDNKLIVLEDLERSGVDIIELMGYVNNLTEQDGVKVLLVANEDEIIKYKEEIIKDKEGKEEKVKVYTETTEEYLRIKEKTISDTILFDNIMVNPVIDIIKDFGNDKLNKYTKEDKVSDIIALFEVYNINNLRSFIFACQKTVEIFNLIKDNIGEEFEKTIFYSNIVFSSRLKTQDKIKWDSETLLSYTLGTFNYPLPKFCFDYIIRHVTNIKNLKRTIEAFDEARLYDSNKSNNDPDLNIIWNYSVKKEEDIITAIQNIENKLDDIDIISFYDYGRLANYLFALSDVLDCKIEKCLEKILNNLKGRNNKLEYYNLFRTGLVISNKETNTKFNEFRKQVEEILKVNRGNFKDFDYTTESLRNWASQIYNNRNVTYSNSFAATIDMPKFIDFLRHCSSDDIHTLRTIFHTVYAAVNIADTFIKDKEYIDLLINECENRRNFLDFDKIQLMQLQWFVNDLKEISVKLSK